MTPEQMAEIDGHVQDDARMENGRDWGFRTTRGETTTPAGPDKVYAALAAVMSDVGAVPKLGKNKEQGYAFRRVTDVYGALQGVMARHGVVCVPYVVHVDREERQTKAGGASFSVRLLIDHTFYADDGSSVTARTLGESFDSGDKASNKAMTAAMKYALCEVFCIPTEEMKDTEDDDHDIQPGEKAKPTPMADESPADTDCPTCGKPMFWFRKNARYECWRSKGGCESTFTQGELEAARAKAAAKQAAPPEPVTRPYTGKRPKEPVAHPGVPENPAAVDEKDIPF